MLKNIFSKISENIPKIFNASRKPIEAVQGTPVNYLAASQLSKGASPCKPPEKKKSPCPPCPKKPSCPPPVKKPREDCPLDRESLGFVTWAFLHTLAAKYPDQPSKKVQKDVRDLLAILSNIFPCDVCSHDFREELRKDPPELQSQYCFSIWLCRIHNKVNKKLEKPQFDCKLINQRWRDGWPDNSCTYKTKL